MNIAIIGSGGVGGYFGAKLANAGNEVTFVARGKHLEAMQQNGLLVKSIMGDFYLKTCNVTDKISDLKQPQLVIMAVKAWQLKELAQQLAEVITDKTVILPLQNGVTAADEICTYIPQQQLLAGLCRILSKIESPGIIQHFGVDPLIVYGELNSSKSERVETIQETFSKAQINSKISGDIQADLWKKFISICTGGLLAVTRCSYGELRENPETRELMYNLLKEIYNLSRKIGINIEPEYVERTLSYVDAFPYDSSSSMARDIWEGKPSELDFQTGTVVRLGKKFGFETPINSFLYTCLLPMERKARR